MQEKKTEEVREEMTEQSVTENVRTGEAVEEKEPFVPSPTSKRVLAWILFVIVFLGIVSWLLSIAFPGWIETVRAWALGLFH
ncbi:MAG: hypothetical protein ACI4V3_09490 [Faecousia sp.]